MVGWGVTPHVKLAPHMTELIKEQSVSLQHAVTRTLLGLIQNLPKRQIAATM